MRARRELVCTAIQQHRRHLWSLEKRCEVQRSQTAKPFRRATMRERRRRMAHVNERFGRRLTAAREVVEPLHPMGL